MTAKVRFFARFRELLGTDIQVPVLEGATIISLVRDVTGRNAEGRAAIFDESGKLREFVIVMRNGKRVEHADAGTERVSDGDEIAIFPPVAGG